MNIKKFSAFTICLALPVSVFGGCAKDAEPESYDDYVVNNPVTEVQVYNEDSSINSLIRKMLIYVFVITAAGTILAVFVAMSLTGAINKGVKVLKELASALTMKTMKETKQIITAQSENMENTAAAVSEVIEGIHSSADSVRIIEKHTGQLENVRADIVKMVEDLTVIAGSTAELSNRTSGEAAKMSSGFSRIENSAAELKRIADELSQCVNEFRI